MKRIGYYSSFILILFLVSCSRSELAADPAPSATTEIIAPVESNATEDTSLSGSAGLVDTAVQPLCNTVKGENATAFAAEVIELTNVERAKVNAGPLTEQTQLSQAAQTQAFDMACNTFLSHTGSDGSSPFDRMIRFGYAFSSAAENVAAGYPSPVDVVQGWMDSPGHRKNMLDPTFNNIGIGYAFNPDTTLQENYFHYWAMTLGTPQ